MCKNFSWSRRGIEFNHEFTATDLTNRSGHLLIFGITSQSQFKFKLSIIFFLLELLWILEWNALFELADVKFIEPWEVEMTYVFYWYSWHDPGLSLRSSNLACSYRGIVFIQHPPFRDWKPPWVSQTSGTDVLDVSTSNLNFLKRWNMRHLASSLVIFIPMHWRGPIPKGR